MKSLRISVVIAHRTPISKLQFFEGILGHTNFRLAAITFAIKV